MADDVRHTMTIGAGGGLAPLGPYNLTSDGTLGLQLYRQGAGTDVAYTVGIDVSQITSLVMVCDVDCTVKTNSTSVPDQTLAFKAGVPLIWHANMPNPCPLTSDVTVLYLTPTAGTVTFQGLVNLNITA